MHHSEPQHDATSPGPRPAGRAPSRRGSRAWGAGGLLAALLLLGAFYLVLEQAMPKAQALGAPQAQALGSACEPAQGRQREGACEASAPIR